MQTILKTAEQLQKIFDRLKFMIGRQYEMKLLNELADKTDSSIVVVHGRRRVGKTFLIEHVYAGRKVLKVEGLEGRPKTAQLEIARSALAKHLRLPEILKIELKHWRDFFDLVAKYSPHEVDTLYLEELQWLANYRTELISDLKYSWDNTLNKLNNFLVVLCGSSPSFMINKVLHSKSLYNRATQEIALKPFSLAETIEFFGSSKSLLEVLDAYLLVGGIPEYLRHLRSSKSIRLALAAQAFTKDGFFVSEYSRILVSALAKNPNYERILKALSRERKLDRSALAAKLKLTPGGSLSNLLDDLENCGFIRNDPPIFSPAHTNLTQYSISDSYIYFYNTFILPIKKRILAGDFNDNPYQAIDERKLAQYLGYAFERFCLANTKLLAAMLGFQSVRYSAAPYYSRKPGVQIDLCFNRADKVITICEAKYHTNNLGKELIKEMQHRVDSLRGLSGFKNRSIESVLFTVTEPSKALTDAGYFYGIYTLKELARVL
jgi:predicted AAA+ superfamily ATPase